MKLFEAVEDKSSSDFFWSIADSFEGIQSYVSKIVQTFGLRHEMTRLAMAEKGMPLWPEIPDHVLSDDAPAALRLRELMAFSRSLLPVPNGGMTVWIFFPPELSDPSGFATLMGDVFHHEFPFPWCHHIRMIIRDPLPNSAVKKLLANQPRIQWYDSDFSPAAVERSMEAEVEDDTRPFEERLSTLLMMAGLDQGHGRFPEALEKYAMLLEYYAADKNQAMVALVLHGMGETYAKSGDEIRAGRYLEDSLALASTGDAPPVSIWLNAAASLANLRMKQERWPEVEVYCDTVQMLAMANRSGPMKILALDQRGVAQVKQGKVTEGVESWALAGAIAEKLGEKKLYRQMLERLQAHFLQTQQVAKLQKIEQRLAATPVVVDKVEA